MDVLPETPITSGD